SEDVDIRPKSLEVWNQQNRQPVRVRDQFPETLLWQPEIITDDNGRASLEFDFADSITTWRMSASAVTDDGKLGSLQSGLRCFQPFVVSLHLPVSFPRNDEVELSAVVSNYLSKAQTVTLTLEKADWFQIQGSNEQKLDLKPNEVTAAVFRVKFTKAGEHSLKIT